MNDILEFSGVLHSDADSGGVYIEFPYDVQEIYGVRGQVKIKATFDGVVYRGSLAKMGHHCHCLLVRKDIQQQIDKKAGDTVAVTVQRDTEERIIEIPEDLAVAFAANPKAAAKFAPLAYTHRKEYVQWINDAKRPETRLRRVEGTIDMLLHGKKNPSDK